MACVGIALIAGACDADQEVDPLVGELGDLCAAVAEDAELADQQSAFFDRAHDAVHELARRATESDPAIGGELLEAKQAIESELGEHFDAPIPTRSFQRLIDAANEALTEVDLDTVSC